MGSNRYSTRGIESGIHRAGGGAHAEETPRLIRQHLPGDCSAGGFVVDSTWRLYVPDGSAGAPAETVASLLSTGTFLMGCEDEYPAPALGVEGAASGTCFGWVPCLTDLATNTTTTISLATYDELGAGALASGVGLSSFYGFPQEWWDDLDDEEDAQNYLIAYVEADGQTGQQEKVLIVGATQAGLQYGVIDWLKSLERVKVPVSGSFREWSPDPGSAASLGHPEICNAYGNAGCDLTTDTVCWGSTWDTIEEVEWCPEQVLNYPDVPKRLGFPGFGGGSANFIPNVLARQHGVATTGSLRCDATSTPPVGEQDWFEGNVLDCDRNGTFNVWGSNSDLCQDAMIRLDALVWGKYTHAIDESYAIWQSDRLEYNTDCDAGLLYEELWEYLRQRRVLLMPSAFGLESRSQEEPVGHRQEDDASGWQASEWGKYGNFTHSEGLGVERREFEVCSDGGGRDFLSPAVATGSLDDAAGRAACVDYFDAGTGAAVGDLIRGGPAVDFDTSLPGTPTGNGIQVGDPSGCWKTTSVDAFGDYAEPDGLSASCDLDITFPLSTATADKLFVVTFQAMVAVDSKNDAGLAATLRVTDVGGGIERSEMSIRETKTGETGYHQTTASGHATYEWVNLSIVLRVPPEDVDGDFVPDISSVVLTLTGGFESGSSLAWLDDIQVLELDGMLRNVDVDSLRFYGQMGYELDPSCFEVLEDAKGFTSSSSPPSAEALPLHYEENSSSDESWLGWHAVLDEYGDPTDYAASIEVLSDPCPRLDAGAAPDWTSAEPVFLSYRTWTHAGLWPKLESTQESYTYSPNVFDSEYWWDRMSPTQQMNSLNALGHTHKWGGDPDKADEFILVSDLGGEIRGVNRASMVEGDVTNAEKLASYYCQLRSGVCSAYEDFTCVGSWDCDSMFLDPSNPSFAPCDCSSWTGVQGPDLLIAADMFALGHNGAQELYQVPYGGEAGETMDALQYMPPDTTFLAWWHFDSKKAGGDVVGQEMAAGLAYELGVWGFDTLGGPARDPDNQRQWAAFAAAGARSDDPFVKGIAYYGWGTDTEGPEYMAQTGHYAWQPEWQLANHWFLSNSPDNPGGDDTAEWGALNMVLVDDGVQRPQFGQALSVTSGNAAWSTPTPLEMDTDQLQPLFQLAAGGWKPQWAPWAQALLRFYTRVPDPSCSIDVDFTFDADHAVSPSVQPATVTPDPAVTGPWADLRVVSARAALPPMLLSVDDISGLDVQIDVFLTGCQGATFDSPALYQGLPFIDFPYVYLEQSIDIEWTSGSDSDATKTACGTLTSPCVNVRSFEAR